jgi:uncharacterized protein (DUF58 family)
MGRGGSIVEPAAVLRTVANPLFLRKLDRFRVRARSDLAARTGATPARRAAQTSGLDLANHRAYSPGDDLRHFDWNAYGRLEQKMIKTFRAERESPLHLLIDTSASMGVPVADGKLALAAGLAASLAYVSLHQRDPVRIAAIGRSRPGGSISPVFRHPGRFDEVRGILAGLSAAGPTILSEGFFAYLQATRLPGLAVVLSDFLVPPGVYERALESLLARGFGLVVLRLIGREERNPAGLGGRLRLCDAETGVEQLVDLTEAHLELYRAALDDHLAALKRWCDSRNALHAVIDTSSGIEPIVLRDLPRFGILH